MANQDYFGALLIERARLEVERDLLWETARLEPPASLEHELAASRADALDDQVTALTKRIDIERRALDRKRAARSEGVSA